MVKKILSACFFILFCLKSVSAFSAENPTADKYNQIAYRIRYVDIDSSLHCARKAYAMARENSDERAFALNNLAYVTYQQMYFDKSLHLLGRIYHETNNQLELLCADVMSMKIAQRIGDGRLFFDKRNAALRRIARINEEKESLEKSQLYRLFYAETELHIVSSTYYYYLLQNTSAIKEISTIEEEVTLERDTSQWLYYHYMLGSGGLIQGNPLEVKLKEFDHLFKVYTLAKASRSVYFEANALQSMAVILSDTLYRHLIKTEKTDAYRFIAAQQYARDRSLLQNDTLRGLSMSLATNALSLFLQYKDLYQTASTFRTIGEIHFSNANYHAALENYLKALALVRSQKNRSSYDIVPWMAGIHERLSMAYSALGEKSHSDYHRNAYLDLLDTSRQDKELDLRSEMLSHELASIHFKLYLLIFLLLLVCVLVFVYAYKVKNRTNSKRHALLHFGDSETYLQMLRCISQYRENQEEKRELLDDECRLSGMKINDYKCENAEDRAKVSLVYSIVPYLDRVLAEINKMKEQGCADENRLDYVNELVAEITRVNDVLTDWIQMNSGQHHLHITTFPIQRVLDVISLSKHQYQQKGIELSVPQTDLRIKADEALTMFMLNTLADNARKFTPEGGRISIQTECTDQYVEISVQDTGIGLSETDVYTLNNSKVYDSSRIGSQQDKKGFGFGIMNCKGIINSYQKLSERFRVCEFRVESRLGKGSRFSFRLPRVLVLTCCFLLPAYAQAVSDRCRELYDSVYNANVAGEYEKAYSFGEQAVTEMGEEVDTLLLLQLRNEMAISALALNEWSMYQYNNEECVRLHRLYSQDNSLASYCLRLEKAGADTRVFYVLLLIVSFVASVLFYLLFFRARITSGGRLTTLLHTLTDSSAEVCQYVRKLSEEADKEKEADARTKSELLCRLSEMKDAAIKLSAQDEKLLQTITSLYADMLQKVDDVDAAEKYIEESQAKHRLLKFEENRFHVMGRILDNSLSTIKHETMYYPARVCQMVEFMQKKGNVSVQDLSEFHDLVLYYRQVYILLYEQAQRQLEQKTLRLAPVSTKSMYDSVKTKLQKHCSSRNLTVDVSIQQDEQVLLADETLLRQLFFHLLLPNMASARQISITHEDSADEVMIRCQIEGVEKTEAEVSALFFPHRDHIPYLIVRQIVREHDAAYGHPGLRLSAAVKPSGFEVSFSLLKFK